MTNDLTRKLAAETNTKLIDLAVKMQGTRSEISDAVHFTEYGSIVVAKIISEELSTQFPMHFILEDL